ncbi:MAG: dipeptide epimerase [Oculatellaceae cyanobacterium bins.114]|nr:dipeptide epimerase [Oculatellaceae cyanobacterium bins.114]
MKLRVTTFTVNKRFPLTISRGTTAQTTNVWLTIAHDGIEGWGEASPFSVRGERQTTEAIAQTLQTLAPQLEAFTPFDQQAIEQRLLELHIPSAARTAIDLALHDWVGKRVGLPLWQLWGLERDRIVPTSATIGISSPEAAQARTRRWLEFAPFQAIKVKLGNPDGIAADQAMLKAVLTEVPKGAKVSIDANGGWSLNDSIWMSHWLADQGVTYIEQPLPEGQEAELPSLYRESPLPIFVDESCFNSDDIPKLADRVHGINIKLMKSGGLTEARRMIATARAHGLQIMFGCYSDSALSNTAAAHLAPFADHLDLDSHLNLIDDPFVGATLENGSLVPTDLPGLGVVRGKAEG